MNLKCLKVIKKKLKKCIKSQRVLNRNLKTSKKRCNQKLKTSPLQKNRVREILEVGLLGCFIALSKKQSQ